MSNIEKYSSEPPKKRNMFLIEGMFQNFHKDDYYLELIISINQESLNIKELSSFLDFIYKIDGYLSPSSFNKYIHNPDKQIKITEIRFGSVELIIQKALDSIDANRLIIIYIALRNLTKIALALPNFAIKVVDYLNKKEEYLERREKRKFRKHLREILNDEVELSNLDDKSKEKLVEILDEIYVKNHKRLGPVSRFVRKEIKSIKLNPKRKK